MKLSNIFLFIGAATASYKLVENRQKIQEEIIETTDSLDKVKPSQYPTKYCHHSRAKRASQSHRSRSYL